MNTNPDELTQLRQEVARLREELQKTHSSRDQLERQVAQYTKLLDALDFSHLRLPARDDSEFLKDLGEELRERVKHG